MTRPASLISLMLATGRAAAATGPVLAEVISRTRATPDLAAIRFNGLALLCNLAPVSCRGGLIHVEPVGFYPYWDAEIAP
jgi:hypothetical protein